MTRIRPGTPNNNPVAYRDPTGLQEEFSLDPNQGSPNPYSEMCLNGVGLIYSCEQDPECTSNTTTYVFPQGQNIWNLTATGSG